MCSRAHGHWPLTSLTQAALRRIHLDLLEPPASGFCPIAQDTKSTPSAESQERIDILRWNYHRWRISLSWGRSWRRSERLKKPPEILELRTSSQPEEDSQLLKTKAEHQQLINTWSKPNSRWLPQLIDITALIEAEICLAGSWDHAKSNKILHEIKDDVIFKMWPSYKSIQSQSQHERQRIISITDIYYSTHARPLFICFPLCLKIWLFNANSARI